MEKSPPAGLREVFLEEVVEEWAFDGQECAMQQEESF